MSVNILQDSSEVIGRWKIIAINDKRYPVRAVERDNCWKIFVTDLVDIWVGNLNREKIYEICERLNPSLSLEDVDVARLVARLLNDIDKKVAAASLERLELVDDLEGGIFKFAFDLTPGTSLQLWQEVTGPLCLVSGELRRRQAILLDLVRKKDREISEYRLNGAELTRKHIETKIFDKDLFATHATEKIAENCMNAFESIMKLRGDVELEKLAIKIEQDSRSPAEVQRPEKSMSRENKIMTEVNAAEMKNFVSTSTNESVISPKIDRIDSPKLVKKRNTLIENDVKVEKPKKARSAPSRGTNIAKTTIHDFIS